MFCNPPYGRQITDWVRKGYEESKKPGTLVVMLIPARTDTSYFHDYIFHGKADEVRFIRGRLTFTDEDGHPTKDAKGRPCSAPFPSAVVIWRSKDVAQSLRDMVLDLIKGRDMTANEIAATLSDRGQQVSRSDVGPILTKAQAAGLIRNAGKRDCSVTGRDRETLFEVNALLPRFEYGREYDQESFLVSMQACFAPSDEREDVAKVASNIVSTQEATFSDDGISQQVVMKTGVTKKENAIIPNPVRLIPYRTFLEVEQPESEFVFRITEGRGGVPFFKLVAADGGRWEAVAVDNVKSYLVEALADIPNREQITIIA